MYGGVPLLLTEVVEPKFDYVRASKEDVLKQAIADVEFAATHLPSLSSVQDGEVSNAAAYHLLSELYLATEQYQKAVDAATTVIDDPATGLMYARLAPDPMKCREMYIGICSGRIIKIEALEIQKESGSFRLRRILLVEVAL